ncbi:MAG: tetratricopeptide repeat protein [Myxococcaceae bacterium]
MTPPRKPGRRARSLEVPTEVIETIQTEGLPAGLADELRAAIEKHRRTALRYERAQNLPKAFGELVKASRAGPMTLRLAAYLAHLGPRLGNTAGAIRLLSTGAEDVHGSERVRIQLRLVRLLRREGQTPQALEVLNDVLQRDPVNPRAHRVHLALLSLTQDWEKLDAGFAQYSAALASDAKPALGAQVELERARLWAGAGANLARASKHFAEAATRFERAGDLTKALEAAIAHLDALEESGAPRERVSLALMATLPLAERAGDVAQTEKLKARSRRPQVATRRRSSRHLIPLATLARRQSLDADGYAELAQHYASAGDSARAEQLEEVSVALRGRARAAVPRVPPLWLTEADKAGLRHPGLRNAGGELLSLTGIALCQVGLPPNRRLLTPFRVSSRVAGPLFADALLSAVRVLGIRASDLYMGFRQAASVEVDFLNDGVCVVLSRRALRAPPSEAVLRFFAGRALFGQSPDLFALRLMATSQWWPMFELLGAALDPDPRKSREARMLSDRFQAKGREQLRELHVAARPTFQVAAFQVAARHSVNRAGLVVCGGLGPALAALEKIGAPRVERDELVRFAASARYLDLRRRATTGERPRPLPG